MKNQKTLILTLTLLLFSIITFGQRNIKDDFSPRGTCKMLNLTDDQEQKMMEFRLEHRETVVGFRNQIEKNRLELEKMLIDGNISESLLNEVTRKNNALKLKIKESRNKMWINTFNILDDEQKTVWKRQMLRKGMGPGNGKDFRHGGFHKKHNRGNGLRDGSCRM